MDLELLKAGYRQVLSHIYSPKAYYDRVITFLREYQPPKLHFSLDLEYLLAWWRSVYQLGIRGAERIHYWRLCLWTLAHKPRLFATAITLAIYGYHFRKVSEMNA